MEAKQTPRRPGRPAVDPATKKKNRAISLTDAQYNELEARAKEAKDAGVSAYIIRVLSL